ncbi:MAG: PIN domain-containing protein [Clostridia bacterium]|nr:PIN domain-containing protein [Clostridia bacterium]
MNALIDTCVVLDALETRGEFSLPARKIIDLAALKKYNGFLTATSVLNIFYLIHKYLHDIDEAKRVIDSICRLFDIMDVKGTSCVAAIFSAVTDYEDAVTEDTAVNNEMDYIVTRNLRDYINSRVKAVSPEEFLSIVFEQEKGEP